MTEEVGIMADYIGQQLGKYRLTKLLGTGGFAEVYLGEHVHLGTEAAIKLLHTQLASEADVEKFRQEARTIASLTHPNIVRVLDFAVEGSTPYLVMDYAPNGSLRQRLPAGKPLTPAEILPYVMQVADALHYAHEQKIVHRDIKPENMLLGRRNEVLLSDFGIATVAQSTTSQKTEGVAGTAAYMAPEQIQGKPRPSSDLYSLGVIVYEWLAGERPFVGTFTEVASQHLFAVPPPLRDKLPGLPPLIEQVVLTALAKDPKDRFGSVRAFATAFAQASGAAMTPASFTTQAAVQPRPGATSATAQPVTVTNQLTPHVTPHITPQVSAIPTNAPTAVPVPAASVQQNSPSGPSVFFSPTQLIVPGAIAVQPPPASSPSASVNAAPQVTGISNSPTYLPPGWASGPAGRRADDTFASVVAAPAPVPAQSSKPRKGLRVALMVLAAVLALALVGGGSAFALPLLLQKTPSTQAGSSQQSNVTTDATVTVTPQSSDVKEAYTITAVTGTPDASQQQVQARAVSVTTQASTQTVNATGTKTTPGTHASGTLTVYTFDTANPLSLAAGTTFPNNGGCTPNSWVVVLDAAVNLPAAPPGGGAPGYYNTTTVPAHIQQAGSAGNFPAQPPSGNISSLVSPLSGSCFSFGYYMGACQYPRTPCLEVLSTSAFAGGTDAQTTTVVAQSDIDNTANSLIQQNQPDATQVVQGQLATNERLVGTPQCQANTSANHNAGDAADQVTVSVTFTCTGEAYDYDGALALATQLLKDQAAQTPGADYALVGQVETTQESATLDDQGAVTIVVDAEGVWAYQFNDSQKQALANLIVSKSKQDAQTILESQTGVARVTIAIANNGQMLPSAASDIMIKIEAVSGA
jgi:serine/threonine protein kinase